MVAGPAPGLLHRLGAMGCLLDAGASRAQGHPTPLHSVAKHLPKLTEKGFSPPQAAGFPTQAVRRSEALARSLHPLPAGLLCGILAVWNRHTSISETSSASISSSTTSSGARVAASQCWWGRWPYAARS